MIGWLREEMARRRAIALNSGCQFLHLFGQVSGGNPLYFSLRIQGINQNE
ncbi:hypothetical protein [Moorena sp. SIO4G3]|nr:hypothetical protein [Moorena sp. SIO4G3]NEO82616.1 hypothetical protein [Moorena sp. SIO4G3]